MAKYRKKPVIIEAEKFDGWPADNSQWVRDAISRTTEPRENGSVTAAFIQTLEGEMRADKGDWIIRGVKGECYPCKPDIFEATYEPAP